MIQRIQSLFLLLVAVSFTFSCFLPVANIITTENLYLFTSWGIKENIPDGVIVYHTFYVGLLQAVLAVLSFTTIFCFKKRPLQSKLCLAAIVMNFALVLLMLWVYPEVVLPKFAQLKGEFLYSGWAMLSVLPLALLYFANKFILRDEKKVRAADRLR